jgi:hypothetical protein
MNIEKLDKHRGFLWIKGKAGTGKSTLMKFVWGNARKRMENHLVLSFFFNARGEELEKSTLGVYRSLLVQLFECRPSLRSVFDSLGLLKSDISLDYPWTVESLEALLLQAIKGLGDLPVVCFIDALDECEEELVRDMVQFLEQISDVAISEGIRFQVCFSSRHYPHITISHGLELVLEGQEGHTQDIANYIKTELKAGNSIIADKIRAKLQKKASGIFMWVVLVVRMLNKDSDRGQVQELWDTLQSIPNDLHQLFSDILTRDSLNRDRLLLCIQWILFSKYPLSPEQLYHAILSGVDPVAMAKMDLGDITEDTIRLFILDSSKGLAEITVSGKPTVQFIHESVRDFFLERNSLDEIWPDFASNFQGQGHELLKQCCLNYIMMVVDSHSKYLCNFSLDLLSEAEGIRKPVKKRMPATQRAPLLKDSSLKSFSDACPTNDSGSSRARDRMLSLKRAFEPASIRSFHADSADVSDSSPVETTWMSKTQISPFLEYSTFNIFSHADSAEGSGISQADFLKVFPLLQWVKLYNLSFETTYPRYAESVSLLYVLAEFDMPSLMTALGSIDQCIEVEDEQYGCPLLAAVARRSESALRLCLNTVEVRQRCRDPDTAAVAKRLLQHDFLYWSYFSDDFNYANGEGFLICAAKMDHEELFELLTVSTNIDIDATDPRGRTALWLASRKGWNKAVGFLLDANPATIDVKDIDGEAPLCAASARGNHQTVALLFNNGANVNAQGGQYGNALQAASAGGHYQTTALLLDNGAIVNARGGQYGNALQAASAGGHYQTTALLLDNGANINAQGGRHGNAIEAALYRYFADVTWLLLERGAVETSQWSDHYVLRHIRKQIPSCAILAPQSPQTPTNRLQTLINELQTLTKALPSM